MTVRFHTQPFLDHVPGAPIDLLGIIAWTAENERNATRERTMGNRRRLRANGAFVEGLPPLGYMVEVVADGTIVAHEYQHFILLSIEADPKSGWEVPGPSSCCAPLGCERDALHE